MIKYLKLHNKTRKQIISLFCFIRVLKFVYLVLVGTDVLILCCSFCYVSEFIQHVIKSILNLQFKTIRRTVHLCDGTFNHPSVEPRLSK